jgi:DnaJ-class molecular chaperone
MAEDYYKILGVPRNASQSDIQKAYRELARKYHPDVNPAKDAKKKFQQVQAAFDVLNNPEKRELYDRYGSSFEAMGAGGPRPNPGGGWQQGSPGEGPSFRFEDLGDLGGFAQFFGDRFQGGGAGVDPNELFKQFRRGGGRRGAGGAPRRGGDAQAEVEIPFNTAVLGGEVQLSIQRESGQAETLAVKIPPGIESGKKIRLRGQGEPAPRGGTPGDLLITVNVAVHPSFTRQGKNLLLRLPLTLAEAAGGAKIDVPTPTGTVALRVPSGTSSGTKLRIRGHGVPAKQGEAGDLLVEVQIVLPKDLTADDIESLRAMDQRHPQHPRENLRW